jgi:hypothetical protein
MKDKLTDSVKVRFPQVVFSDLQTLAQRNGLTVSDLVRISVRGSLRLWKKKTGVIVLQN